jgi:adenylylsulfate kinase
MSYFPAPLPGLCHRTWGNLTRGVTLIPDASELSGAPRPDRRGVTVWFTGLPCAGKTTASAAVASQLEACGVPVELLDADALRLTISRGLGFSKEDRDENIRRIGFVCGLLARHGVVVLVSAIAPYREVRAEIRAQLGRFVEVYVNAPLAVCEGRDVRGLYRRARIGEMRGLTGVDAPYEPPESPDVECRTDLETIEQSAAKVVAFLRKNYAELFLR